MTPSKPPEAATPRTAAPTAPPAPTRTCIDCNTTYPATLDHFYRSHIRKDGTVGLTPRCQRCVRNRNHIANQRRRRFLSNLRAAATSGLTSSGTTKRCPACELEYPATSFFFQHSHTPRNPYHLDILCKVCRNIQDYRKRITILRSNLPNQETSLLDEETLASITPENPLDDTL